MDFIEYITDQQNNLQSTNYQDMLWSQIREDIETVPNVTLEDEEIYQNHIPLEFTRFLKKCVKRLRELKTSGETINWDDLDNKYVSTLLLFALQQEDVSLDNSLYAANIFFLINIIYLENNQFFHTVLYLKSMEALKEFNRSQDMINTAIIYLMDDFKMFLSKLPIQEDLIMPTVSVLHDYTYCCKEAFEDFNLDVSFVDLGYIAFVGLKALVEQLSRQRNNDRKLFPILIALTSNLKSNTKVSKTVLIPHQSNVRLFIKQNFYKFTSKSFSLVTEMLKFVYLNSEYNDHNGIAKIIQELPPETYRNFMMFFQQALLCDNVEFRRNSLNMVLPILKHPVEHEPNEKRLTRAEIFMNGVIKLCGDKDREVQYRALRILSEYCDNNVGQQIIKKIICRDNSINKDSIMSSIHKIVDQRWQKKEVNVNYVRFICSLLSAHEDLINVRILNQLRGVCLAGSPFDLKPCIGHLRCLLKSHIKRPSVIIYVLSIFVKQLFHPMQTSIVFAKDLHDFIFSHITLRDTDNFIWNIVNYLISNNFHVLGVFEKFHSLNLLRENSIKILMEHKIQNEQIRTSALKLLCVMLHFVRYKNSRPLEEKLERVITCNQIIMSDVDMYLIIYALNKQMEQKKPEECNQADISNYRRLYNLINQAFSDQLFPITCTKHVIILLSSYARLLGENPSWYQAACSQFENNLKIKLTQIVEKKLEHSVYISRDVIYLAELIILKKVVLNEDNFKQLKSIASINNRTSNFVSYLKNHEEIWSLCLYLYIKSCFINEDLIPECIRSIENVMELAGDNIKLHMFYGLLDVCNMHLQYYDPLIPHLFSALYNKNAYIRFVASKILMQLIGDEQLRLMDGQYFLFMGLLADDKEIIARNVGIFVKEKYVNKYQQTIARYFVPSIIHYNLCYDHPTISLSESDQDLLKKRIYSLKVRTFIYRCLYEFLSDKLKFSILSQISSEIIVRILKKTIPHSEEVFCILEDALTIILYTVPSNKIDNIEDDRKFYEVELKKIDSDLLVANLRNTETNISTDHCIILRNLLTSLLQLLFSEIGTNSKICQNLLFTIIVITKTFYSAIKRTLIEESSSLKGLYKKLSKFYVEMKHNFEYCLITVNPRKIGCISENEDFEFYMHEFNNFHLISPNLILGVGE